MVSRESCIAGSEETLRSLTAALTHTDLLMADIIQGLGRLDSVLANAARAEAWAERTPHAAAHAAVAASGGAATAASAPVSGRRGGWATLSPAYRSMLAASKNRSLPASLNPASFRRGMVQEYAASVAATGGGASAGVGVSTSASSLHPSGPPAALLLTPTHASLNAALGRCALAAAPPNPLLPPLSSDAGPVTPVAQLISQHQAPAMFSPDTPHAPPHARAPHTIGDGEQQQEEEEAATTKSIA